MGSYKEVEKYIDYRKQSHGADTAEKLLAYVDRILEINEHINLTAVRDRDEAIVKHLADSLPIQILCPSGLHFEKTQGN